MDFIWGIVLFLFSKDGNLVDLRRYIRVPVERPVFVTTPSDGQRAVSVWSFELGEGGCLLVGDTFFGVGRVLIVDLMLDSRRPVRAIGKVLYEYRDLNVRVCSGLEFQYIDGEHLESLKDYIQHRSPQEVSHAIA